MLGDKQLHLGGYHSETPEPENTQQAHLQVLIPLWGKTKTVIEVWIAQ